MDMGGIKRGTQHVKDQIVSRLSKLIKYISINNTLLKFLLMSINEKSKPHYKSLDVNNKVLVYP